MNVKEIKELVDLVSRRGLAGLEIERAGFRLRIEGAPAHRAAPVFTQALADPATSEAPALPPAAPASLAAQHVAPGPPGSGEREGFHVITAPIVGTFYRAANPDAEPFVKVGDVVEKGKTLCIVEAMKLMNEIESDTSGEVLRVFVENGQPVEYGQPLFGIRPSRKK